MKDKLLIDKIKESIGETLNEYGFDCGNYIEENKKCEKWHRWRRYNQWKVDEFSMHYVVDPMLVNLILSVYIKSNNRTVELIGTNLEWIVADRLQGYYLPLLFKSKLIKRIELHVKNAVPWFDIFSTPSACLNEIKEDRHTLGGKGSVDYDEVVLFLNKIKDKYDADNNYIKLDTTNVFKKWRRY